MHKQATRKVLAVLDDLFFTVKIKDAAARAGLDVEFLKSADAVLERAKDNPTVIVVDLNTTSVQPLELIQRLKAAADLRQISVIGYVSHVQGELKQKAHESGCDMVLARSAFSQNLPQIFKRHAGLLAG
ncbi:MAG TPA: response regulator [Bryobacteraceae bacterium]|nr:response regulator [Bryobacteraceae bacterium]